MSKKSQINELLLYSVFGALSTMLDIGLFWFLTSIVDFHYLVANGLAWIIAVTFSFIANKYYVFKSKSFKKDVWLKEAVEFYGARGGACAVDMGGMFLLVSVLDQNKNLAKIGITLIVIIVNYVLSKFWIFKDNGNKEFCNSNSLSERI